MQMQTDELIINEKKNTLSEPLGLEHQQVCSYFDSMQIISKKKQSQQQSADSSIRKIIYTLCKTDNQFNALLTDKFKHLQKDISESNSLEQKVNILLNIESKHVILDGIRDAIEDKLIFPGISDEKYSDICDEIARIKKLPNLERKRHKRSKFVIITKRIIRRILVALGVAWLTEKAILAWIWNKIRENTVVSGGVLIIFFGAGGGIIISYKSGCIHFKTTDPPRLRPIAQIPVCIGNLLITADHKSEPIRNESLSNKARNILPQILGAILDRNARMSKSLHDSRIYKNQNFPSMEAIFPHTGSADESKNTIIACAGSKDGRLPIDVNFSFVKETHGTVKNCNDNESCHPSIHYSISCEFSYKVIDPEKRYECPQPYNPGPSGRIPDIMLPHSNNMLANDDTEEMLSIFNHCGGLFNVIAQLAGCRQK